METRNPSHAANSPDPARGAAAGDPGWRWGRRPGGHGPHRGHGWGRRWRWGAVAAAVAGTLSLGACGHGGWRHGQGDGPVAMTPEEAGRRIDKVVEWVLSDVDASAEQKQRVGEIARGAARELIPLREQHRQARGRALDLFAQPVLDRAAIERLRAEELALADQASRVLVAALSDAMEVLTPAQRVQLAERVRRRHG